jgi:hypothetical protein
MGTVVVQSLGVVGVGAACCNRATAADPTGYVEEEFVPVPRAARVGAADSVHNKRPEWMCMKHDSPTLPFASGHI